MKWPNHADYAEVIQNPEVCFEQPELQNTTAATTALGLPRALSGNFASVYEVSNDRQTYAVRCFIRQVTNQKTRYAKLDKYLSSLDLPFMVPFEFVSKGIRVNDDWYPIVKMDWVSGDPLHTYVEKHLDQPSKIELLSINWREMVRTLEENEIGHGDLQHGNILVTAEDELKLVDYDGTFVPLFANEKSPELGHPNFQHPLRTPDFYDERLDRFSSLLIYLNLKAVSAEPGLWKKFHIGDNLLVTAADMRVPQSSELWPLLLNSPDEEVQKLTVFLTDFLKVQPLNIPDLETVLESSIRGIVVPIDMDFAPPEPEPLATQARHGRERKDETGNDAPILPVKVFEIMGWSAVLFALLALVPPLRVLGGAGALLLGIGSLLMPGKRLHYNRGFALLALCIGLARLIDSPELEVSARKTKPADIPPTLRTKIGPDEVDIKKETDPGEPEFGSSPGTVPKTPDRPLIQHAPQSVSLPLIEPTERPVVRPQSTWTAHRQGVSSMAFTGNGRNLITTSADQVLSIWNASTGKEIHSVSDLPEPVLSITTLTNAGIFATANRAANLQWWSVDGGIPLKQIQLSDNSLFPPSVSKDGHLIATAGEDRRSIALHRNGSPMPSDTISGFSSWVKDVRFSADNHLAIVLTYDDAISVRNALTGKIVQTFSYPDADIQQIECSPDGRWLAALGSTGHVRVWDIIAGKLTANTGVKTGGISSAVFSLDGNWVLIGTGTGQIYCMFSSNGLVRTPKLETRTAITSIALSPDGEILATGNNKGEVSLWDNVQIVGGSAVQMARP